MRYPDLKTPTPKVITEPLIEPITLSEAKAHLRVDSIDEDALILGYIKSARKYLEWRTGRALFSQTLEIVMDRFPSSSVTHVRLPRATPLTAVDSVKYTDDDGTETTWDASLYALDTDNYPGSLRPIPGETYPDFTPHPVNAVRIRYTCGDNSSPLVAPELYKIPIYLLLERFYDHRSNFAFDARGDLVPEIGYGIEPFIAQLKVEYVF
jgi:uncharacterized phiE125 gp8 family phage protein